MPQDPAEPMDPLPKDPERETGPALLSLAERDPKRAARALSQWEPAHQAEVLCQVPAAARPALLAQLAEPELVIPELPEGELCFSAKAAGLHDAGWIVEHARSEQLVACVDLDAWPEGELSTEALHEWMRCFADAGDETLLRAAEELDAELLVLWLRDRMLVVQRDLPASEFEPPRDAKTLDGNFYLIARRDKDDLSVPIQLLMLLFEARPADYERALLGVCNEPTAESEEWALRWRSGRMQELGFPRREETYGLYTPLRSGDLDRAPEVERAVEAWPLPVWIPSLPAPDPDALPIFHAAAALPEAAARSFFYGLAGLANAVAVADRLPLGDAESVPRAMERAAEIASRGMQILARHRRWSDAETLERVPLPFLFRVGHGAASRESGE